MCVVEFGGTHREERDSKTLENGRGKGSHKRYLERDTVFQYLYANIRNLQAKMEELQYLVLIEGLDIVGITES